MIYNTIKKLSYAGVSLTLATPELEAWLASVHPQDFADFSAWSFADPTVLTQSLPTPPIPTPPDFKIGVLTYPTGASRPAWFHFIVNTAKLNEIKSAEGSTTSLQPLVMFDGRAGKTITAQMFRLPERNLAELGHTDTDSWLVTLTDVRFYWHWRRGIITQPTSWTDLFSQLGAILGVAITVDNIPSAYGSPSTKWALPYAPTPVVLDAAAAQVGQRVVVGLDGSVKTVRWESARDASNTYLAGADPLLSGSTTSTTGISRYVPSSLRTLFADTTISPFAPSPFVVENTLTSLAIPDYGAATGVAGYYQSLFADLQYDGNNGGACSDWAVQASSDWYGWRLADADIVWPGIEAWEPTGWEDEVRWTFQVREDGPFASTMVRRGVWNDFQSGDWYAGLTPIPSDWFPSGSGSGSGSGGCTTIVSTECNRGKRTLTTKEVRVGIENNQIQLIECSTTTSDLGPCSPNNPDGILVPIVTAVCPGDCWPPVGEVVILPTISSGSGSGSGEEVGTCYLKCDGSDVLRETYPDLDAVYAALMYPFGDGDGSTTFTLPDVPDLIPGLSYFVRIKSPTIVNQRVLARIPVVDVQGCVEFQVGDCCEGSGSGSGGGCPGGVCPATCDQCEVTSGAWILSFDGVNVATLCYVGFPDDSNLCRWSSLDLVWDLRFDYDTSLWVLTNLDDPPENRRIWYVDGAAWQCLDVNTLTPFDAGESSAVLTPADNCYSCEGSGSGTTCVAIPDTESTYRTLTECQAVCGGVVVTPCCPGTLLPPILYGTFGGVLAGLGTSVPLVWNGSVITPVWSATISGCGGSVVVTVSCLISDFSVDIAGSSVGTAATPVTRCSPLLWSSGDFSVVGGCSGNGSITVTTTP